MIPAEAVEVAADTFVKMRKEGEHSSYEYARAALEAAAPYLMAAAWEAGEKTGYSNCVAAEHGLEQASNPYRSPHAN